MTLDEMIEKWEEASENSDYKWHSDGRFGTKRNDLHAFMLLDSILPPQPNKGGWIMDMISSAWHDQIALDVDLDELAAVITEEQIIELDRCGIFISSEYDCLSMFR